MPADPASKHQQAHASKVCLVFLSVMWWYHIHYIDLVICRYAPKICQVGTGKIRGQMSLQARPQMLTIDQALVYPSWMKIILRDFFELTIAILSFSLSEEVTGSYRTKHLLCEVSIIIFGGIVSGFSGFCFLYTMLHQLWTPHLGLTRLADLCSV